MKDNIDINTIIGTLTIEINEDTGVYITLNNAPVIQLKAAKYLNKDKLIVKNYHHKQSVQDDEYFDIEEHGFDPNNIDEDLREYYNEKFEEAEIEEKLEDVEELLQIRNDENNENIGELISSLIRKKILEDKDEKRDS